MSVVRDWRRRAGSRGSTSQLTLSRSPEVARWALCARATSGWEWRFYRPADAGPFAANARAGGRELLGFGFCFGPGRIAVGDR